MIISQEFERFERSFKEMMKRQEMQIELLKEQNNLLRKKYELEIDNNKQLEDIAETVDYLYALIGKNSYKKQKIEREE